MSAATGSGLDLTKERIQDFGSLAMNTLKGFQRTLGLTVDGAAHPGGPMAKALESSLNSGANPHPAIRSGMTNKSTKPKNEMRFVSGKRPTQVAQRRQGTQTRRLGLPYPQDVVRGNKFRLEKGPGGQNRTPVVTGQANRIANIVASTPGHFQVRNNANATSAAPLNALPPDNEVSQHDAIIESEARRTGVDPDLVRAIMYVETTQGGSYGRVGELISPITKRWLGFEAKSLLPMNVRFDTWEGLGFSKTMLDDPRLNVRAGAMLLKRIRDRIPNATVAQIATVYNFTGGTVVSDYGARVAAVYRSKEWKKLAPNFDPSAP